MRWYTISVTFVYVVTCQDHVYIHRYPMHAGLRVTVSCNIENDTRHSWAVYMYSSEELIYHVSVYPVLNRAI